ncbi:MAG: TlpA family protein disulfide reductase [Acidimicrobiales bacterium]
MPGWQALQEELADHNFQVIAVAIDENVDQVRQFMDGITYPVLIDADHLLTELYAISNVPSVLMIDEDDRIVQPNWNAYATNTFKEYTGIESADQIEIIRRWVVDGTPMMTADEARTAVGDLSPDEEQAKLYFRIAIRLRDGGDDDGAARNFDRAAELAPHDWTIRRAMMPLRGGDPFGDEFFELAAEYNAAGRPFHGVAAPRP